MAASSARVLQLGAPLLLAGLELGHPRGAAADLAALMPIADWWLTLHLLQLPLFGVVTWSIAGMLRGTRGTCTSVSRVALLLFAISFTVLDLVAGVGTGIIARLAASWPPEQQSLASAQMQYWLSGPLIGTRLSVVDFVVANAWLIGLVAAAGALAQANRAKLASLSFLWLAGLALWFGGHASPYGPIALVCVFLCECDYLP